MIYILIKTNKKLTLQKEIEIKKIFESELKDDILLHIEDHQIIYYKNNEECMIIEINEQERNKLEKCKKEIKRLTNIKEENIFINFI